METGNFEENFQQVSRWSLHFRLVIADLSGDSKFEFF
jgi:hypothetical protein